MLKCVSVSVEWGVFRRAETGYFGCGNAEINHEISYFEVNILTPSDPPDRHTDVPLMQSTDATEPLLWTRGNSLAAAACKYSLPTDCVSEFSFL